MKENILAFLREHPETAPNLIADSLGAKAASVRKALTILRRQKKVKRWNNGTYSAIQPTEASPTPETQAVPATSSETSTATAQ